MASVRVGTNGKQRATLVEFEDFNIRSNTLGLVGNFLNALLQEFNGFRIATFSPGLICSVKSLIEATGESG